MNGEGVAFAGELMLAGWSETHTGGAKVTFWLPDASDLESFRSMTVRKGNASGQRFMAVLVELGPNDEPVPQDRDRRPGPLLQSALALCRTEDFQRFAIASMGRASIAGFSSEDAAAAHIKSFCRVSSRKDLDGSRAAAEMFSRLMHLYRSWRAENAGAE
jgi:hypothetical protein